MRKRAFVALAIFALAACGGGGGGSAPVPSVPQSARPSNAVFSITVPAASGSDASRKRNYVSPNAQSLTIAVNGAAPSLTANITPNSGGCTTSGGATTCSLSVSAPEGSDTFTVTLYAGTNATGAQLGSGTVSAAVGASPTPIDITLNGVVSTVAITLADSTPLAGTAATIPVTVTAKDASGATIIAPGGYSPAITLTNSDTSGHTVLSTTSVSDPNVAVTLAYDGSSAVTSATISAAAGGSITGVTSATLTPQIATPTPSPTPTPTPTPALITLPSSLSFTLPNVTTGITVMESGYSGTFSETDDCNPQAGTIASISPTSASGPSATFNVTSVGAGHCIITFKDQNGQSAAVSVDVTITQGVIQ